jgi:hypothetical protein
MREHGYVSAVLALQQLTMLNAPNGIGDATAHLPNPWKPLRAGRLALTVHGLSLGTGGFQLTATSQIATYGLDSQTVFRWVGFTRVNDDLGHAYLASGFEIDNRDSISANGAALKLTFYPAVSPTASELVFRCCPVTLEVLDGYVPGGELDFSTLDIADELTARISLRTLRHDQPPGT